MTEIPVPSGSRPSLLVTGPDGNLWSFGSQLAGSKTIIRLTPPNTFTEFPYPADRAASTLVSGPDGHLWMLDPPANRITRMSPVDRTFRDYPVPTPNAGLTQMTFGPDGNLWFTEINAGKIGRLIP